ncbi:thioredoxin family protein [Paenibacillus lutrae]|uniref:Thioredoxin n=1 Tax=Paenibacillus lutrae TaxID=2078573 RepID=A0A7X3FF80_9BACL|nr:thioredoxin family protein [Paenibacillus lutrae]MVO98544.1 thioredoxin [Paenibacillus lutrae]
MKKLGIYLGIIIILFAGIFVLTKQSNKGNDEAANKLYGVPASKLQPATRDILEDPNYQNLIKPAELDKRIADKESFFLYFYGADCPHCKVTTPVLVPLQKELGVDVKQFNLLEFKEGWQKYNIEYTPTLVYYKDGVQVDKMVGGVPENGATEGNTPEKFKEFFNKYKTK